MGSEMCIRDRSHDDVVDGDQGGIVVVCAGVRGKGVDDEDAFASTCLLYTSDAADERSSVDLGGRRIIKKKNMCRHGGNRRNTEKIDKRTENAHAQNSR